MKGFNNEEMKSFNDELLEMLLEIYHKLASFMTIEQADRLASAILETNNDFVEMPNDADGEPIRLGSRRYDDNGNEVIIKRITFFDNKEPTVMGHVDGHKDFFLTQFNCDELHSKRPDSFERIADELDEIAYLTIVGSECTADDIDHFHNMAARIRRLAGGDGNE